MLIGSIQNTLTPILFEFYSEHHSEQSLVNDIVLHVTLCTVHKTYLYNIYVWCVLSINSRLLNRMRKRNNLNLCESIRIILQNTTKIPTFPFQILKKNCDSIFKNFIFLISFLQNFSLSKKSVEQSIWYTDFFFFHNGWFHVRHWKIHSANCLFICIQYDYSISIGET